MSQDKILEDELAMTVDAENALGGNTYDDQISVSPVRGKSAIKGLFNKENKWRLIFGGCVGVLLVGALIYVYSSHDLNDMAKGGNGTVRANPVLTQSNATPSAAQVAEAERYNSEELAKLQKTKPTEHPIIVTEPDNPFEKKSDLAAPSKLSEVGSTEQAGGRAAARQTGNNAQPKDWKTTDDFLAKLIENESKSPELLTVEWGYSKPRAAQAANAGAGTTAKGETEAGTGSRQCPKPLTRAATMYMATADLALNSDVGGPVSLTIQNGRLKGGKVLGSFERKEEWLRMELKRLVTPQETLSVEAIGLDVDTTLNAVQGEVNNHTLYRYGWWGLGSVLGAIGKAAEKNADSNVIISNGTALQTTQADTAREMKIAIGSLGQDIGDVMRDRLNRPITVSLNVGDEVGVFFLDDVCLKN